MAQDNLEDYLLQYDVDLGTARKTVADAKFALDQAEDAVSDFADMHGESFVCRGGATLGSSSEIEGNAQDAVTDFLAAPQRSGGRARVSDSQDRK